MFANFYEFILIRTLLQIYKKNPAFLAYNLILISIRVSSGNIPLDMLS